MTTEDQELAALFQAQPPRSPERLLREAAACVVAMPKPWKLATRRYQSRDQRECCALGALSIVCSDGTGTDLELIDAVLQIDFYKRFEITMGFDNRPSQDNEWSALGARLRRDLLGAPAPAGQGAM